MWQFLFGRNMQGSSPETKNNLYKTSKGSTEIQPGAVENFTAC